MPPASEEMKQWSALLGEELSKWPKVTARPMFGLRGFYRGKKIFAALPVTRAIKNPNSLIFRIKPLPPDLLERAKKEPRIDTETRAPGAKMVCIRAEFRSRLPRRLVVDKPSL
jgi:hypothetical protein